MPRRRSGTAQSGAPSARTPDSSLSRGGSFPGSSLLRGVDGGLIARDAPSGLETGSGAIPHRCRCGFERHSATPEEGPGGAATKIDRGACHLGSVGSVRHTTAWGYERTDEGHRREREGRTARRIDAMTSHVLHLALYRFRATFGRRRGGYLALVLLVGLMGGVAMGAVAGARRTQSAFPVYLASTNPSRRAVLHRVHPHHEHRVLGEARPRHRPAARRRARRGHRRVRSAPSPRSPSSAVGTPSPARRRRPSRAASTGSTRPSTGSPSSRAGWPTPTARTSSSCRRAAPPSTGCTSARPWPSASTPTPRWLAHLRRLPRRPALRVDQLEAGRHRRVELPGRPGRRRRPGNQFAVFTRP